jgi:pyridinium-3,5-biscarboxylic acid mononucleotide sulfurtransferase
MTDAIAKERQLVRWLREQRSVLVGFSGGVDSAYLACVAVATLGAPNVLAVIGRSASYPAEQWATARRVADQFGIPVDEIDTDEINDPRYAANPSNRCYFCKTELWGRLVPVARARGLATVIDGTNADDRLGHRPGALAAREHGVASPLADVGLTKDEIRERSRARGIPTWAQPSSPCLSSRIPYGTPVTPQRLRQVESAERALRELGVRGDLRVRHHGPLARLEMAPEAMADWMTIDGQDAIADAVEGAGYTRVGVELAGFRSGSLNSDTKMHDLPDLADLGLVCERVGRVAVVSGRGGGVEWMADAELRGSVLARCRASGFTQVAAELSRAPLPRA